MYAILFHPWLNIGVQNPVRLSNMSKSRALTFPANSAASLAPWTRTYPVYEAAPGASLSPYAL